MTSATNKQLLPLKELKDKPAEGFTLANAVLIDASGTAPGLGCLLIRDGRIISRTEKPDPEFPVYDASGYFIFPGLVNAHTHCAMGFFRGLGHGRPDMIESFLFPAEKSLTPDLVEDLSLSYIAAGIRCGVTMFSDHYYFVAGVGRAIDRLGARGIIGETVADLGGAFPGEDSFKRMEQLLQQWKFSSRITASVAPHAADTVSPAQLKRLAAFAKKNNLPLHMHLAQTSGERRRVSAREKLSPVRYAQGCGALSPRTIAVHLIACDDEDITILKGEGVTAGICPISEVIYERLPAIATFKKAGIPTALGTDCAASNDSSDMMAEMRFYNLMMRDRGLSVSEITFAETLATATVNGARLAGKPELTGLLTPGSVADLVMMRARIDLLPATDPLANLICSAGAGHVDHVLVDGRFILRERQLTRVVEADLLAAYNAATEKITRASLLR
jgi:5-methylthioadenosine/S-adenosylhomocysteine deaminase